MKFYTKVILILILALSQFVYSLASSLNNYGTLRKVKKHSSNRKKVVHHYHHKHHSSNLPKAVNTNSNNPQASPKTTTKSETEQKSDFSKFIAKYLSNDKPETFQHIPEAGSCSEEENDSKINFDLIPNIEISFRSIIKALLALKKSSSFQMCYGKFKADEVYTNVAGYKEKKICERLLLSKEHEYSIIALDFANFGCGSLCLAFDDVGTVNFSMDTSSVMCLKAFQYMEFNVQSSVLLGLAFGMKNPIDIGFSPQRRLAKTNLMPYLDKDNMVQLKPMELKSQFSFYLPKNLNPLKFIDAIPAIIKDVVDIPVNAPVLVDFGPTNTNIGQILGNYLNGGKATNIDFAKLITGAELFTSISGEIIIKIPNTIGFPNPLTFGTKNLGLLIKTSDEDFKNGYNEAGFYLGIPPEAHYLLHDFLRENLKKLKIYLPKEPSLKIGLMFTTKRIGWIIELPNNNIKWTCNIPVVNTNSVNVLDNSKCKLYIGKQTPRKINK